MGILASLAGGPGLAGEPLWAAAAGLGAALLGRHLGLSWPGALLAGGAFAFSAPLQDSAAPVFLPWALLGLEVLRERSSLAGLTLAAAATAASIAAGPPGAAFACALFALSWWGAGAVRAPAHGAAGLGALLGGLGLAGLLGRLPPWPQAGPPLPLDFAALASILLVSGGLLLWQRAPAKLRLRLAAAAGLAPFLLAAILARRGLDPGAGALFFPSLSPGHPPAPPVATLGLAAAGLLSGPILVRRGGLVAAIAWWGLLLALAAPGLAGLWRALPFLGALPPASAAGPATLCLALLAGAALARTSWDARVAGAIAVISLAGLSAAALLREGPVPWVALDRPDEALSFELGPLEPGGPLVRGSVHAALPADEVLLWLDPLEPGRASSICVSAPLPPMPEGGEQGSDRTFALGSEALLEQLAAGRWLVRLELAGRGSDGARALLGARRVGLVEKPRSAAALARAAAELLAAVLLLLLARGRWSAWAACAGALGLTWLGWTAR